jgi:hypothetical protein
LAAVITAVISDLVAVITSLTRPNKAVAAGGLSAGVQAGIGLHLVAVIAGLSWPDKAITAGG